jgi:hypothetical protein
VINLAAPAPLADFAKSKKGSSFARALELAEEDMVVIV